MKLFSITVFLLIYSLTTLGQKQNNIWNFGLESSLDFNSGTPVPRNFSKIYTYEGCTSIADYQGNLLFYSDGVTVWNKNNLPMQNGTGLMGHTSATQSVIALPKPGSKGIYYLFTVDAGESTFQHGLRYSVIDLNQNSGLGAVTSAKNVLLTTPVTEKLTSVLHANGVDYWVLVHAWNSSDFLAFLVTDNGVSGTPVSSNVGWVHQGNVSNSQGGMKGSPSGSKLALATFRNSFQLFDFNNSTGVVSNFRVSSQTYTGAYDVEFSPDESKLYGSAHNNETYQFDLNSPSVFSTGLQIGTIEIGSGGTALQVGPDNKIYKARGLSEFLGVINNPNLRGPSCNYVNRGLYLGGFLQSGNPASSFLGLPSFPAGGFGISSFTFESPCAGYPVNFSIPNYKPGNQVSWNFGDTLSGNRNTATGEKPSHTFDLPGTYQVSLTVIQNGFTRQIQESIIVYPIPNANLGNDTTICEGGSILLQKNEEPGTTYLWQDGSNRNYFYVDKPGTYSLQVVRHNCSASDTIKISFRKCGVSMFPNVITPNGDNLNDNFVIPDHEGRNYSVKFFNRWGKSVYESNNYLNDWNADGLAPGIYYYLITQPETSKVYKGWVEVIK